MLRRAFALFTILTLITSLIVIAPNQSAEAATGNFNFPNESYSSTSPRTTTDEMVTLTGTINNVDPNEIYYSIYQIVDQKDTSTSVDDVIGSKRENVSNNIYIQDGTGITIFNLQLFAGLNKITFVGKQGFSEVTDTIYIDFRNGPVLFDLKAALDGNIFLINEDEPTVVHSVPSKGLAASNISITGNAPNATGVTIISNGQSNTYPVNAQSNWSFTAAPVYLKHGKNLVTIKVANASQVIETTREIAFYNGSVTFYDAQIFKDLNAGNNQIDPGETPAALEYAPNYSIHTIADPLKIFGRVILPNEFYNGIAHPDPNASTMQYSLKSGNTTLIGPNTVNLNVIGAVYVADPFFEYEFTIDLATEIAAYNLTNPGNPITFDKLYELKLEAQNETNIRLGTGSPWEGSNDGELMFSLRNASEAYIYDINYITGYLPPYSSKTVYDGMASVDLENANIFNVPIGVEVLIGNPNEIHPSAITNDYIKDLIQINKVTDANGVEYTNHPNDFDYKLDIYPNDERMRPIVTRTINGTPQEFLRVIVEITKLPRTGTQTIEFQLNNSWEWGSGAAGTGNVSSELKEVDVTLVYGPFVQFNGLYDGMQVSDDTTSSTRQDHLINTVFQEFKGQLMNIANTNDIRYADAAPLLRTVYFYINNTQVDIESTVATNAHATTFKIIDAEKPKAFSALLSGENTFTFEYRTKNHTYQKKVKVNLIPTNLPVIPAPNTEGVFPYTTGSTPNPNDANFTSSGGVYTTKLGRMDVFGTFDFIDLGTNTSTVNSRLTSGNFDLTNYILRIESAGQNAIEWNLSNQFTSFDANGATTTHNTVPVSGLQVRYDLVKQSFTFNLPNQLIPADGSSRIYNFYVYNSGKAGPRASYRLEVDPTSLPYTVVRPLLPQKRITNANYVEVILYSEGADQVVIGKQVAEVISYDVDGDGSPDPAFRAIVSDLKANRDSKIDFTISRGDDKISDSITVRYEPTNIPGGQFMDVMGSNHKLFDSTLNLKFDKGTTLIRKDYNDTADLKNQIFTGHQLLFAIANPQDGVVDRREFEVKPANFDSIVSSFGARFSASFPMRYVKASSVFWIDAGMADNPLTTIYDPLTTGALPYQYPNSGIPTYDQRPANRELMPSKRGELTLSFDPDIRTQAATGVSVFRYDPEVKYWQNLGGTVDSKKNTITVQFDRFGYYVVGKMSYSFTDITQHPYARNYMDAVYAKGVMNAVSFGEFGGDYYVTRGEFATMVVKALELPLDYAVGRGHFDDVPYIINPDALWDYRYIETAARVGIIRGTLPRIFEPNNTLTREQATSILATGLNMKQETDAAKVDKELQKAFKDYTNIATYFKPAVAAIAKKGFILGKPIDPANPKAGYSFEPKSRLTRAEAAIIIAKVMADMKKLPKIY